MWVLKCKVNREVHEIESDDIGALQITLTKLLRGGISGFIWRNL